eukprot:Blabericola_migrator_1__9786@NODE_536_length_7757_cov_263_784395_g64_i2_p2_GENE_NODE_536_length_7757_cov_263_784395_g64_i2NODE_536_length_7757_cov_263_784395_g64_i2_p2_ORF_typecomplete_len479_score66_10UNC93/PF05978_16/7_4e17UNC93/PF05978_16/2_7e03UNC93/PF05978_16/1_1e03MFS_1/PF07690_16/3_1e13Sugar_tr/PF00083_24/3_3e09MFS_3/PF05977_13/4_4e09MFS_3/PF05977_13/1_4e03MFS_4/PF06779_14/3_1e03MFS_4/PF06779_14/8_5e06MFS_4/PF06779_14/6_9e02PUCC/PF03209_15/1_7e05PUCC/PF03209_15/4_9e02OATP/PF03137_20/0_042
MQAIRRRWKQWDRRKAKCQVVLLGLLGAFGPGFYNGLFSFYGARADIDGSLDEYAKRVDLIANALTYSTFGLVCLLGSLLLCMLDQETILTLGGCSYGLFAMLMYFARRYNSALWLAIVAGVLLGIGAAFYWTVSAALVLTYAPKYKKGRYAAIYWSVFNCGAVLASVIDLWVVSITGKESSMALYWLLLVLSFAGAIMIPRLVCDPMDVKVEHTSTPNSLTYEMTEIKFQAPDQSAESFYDEVLAMLHVCIIPEMLLMSLLFVGSLWCQSYENNFITHFLASSKMSRILSTVHWAVQVMVPLCTFHPLDNPRWSLKRRCMCFFVFWITTWAVTLTLAVFAQYFLEGGYDKDRPIENLIKWNEPHRAIIPLLLSALFGVAECLTQMYIYWFLAVLTQNDVMKAVRYQGYFKGLQSLGDAAAWGLSIADSHTYRFQLWVCIAHFLLDLPLTFIAASNIHYLDHQIEEKTKAPALHMPLI